MALYISNVSPPENPVVGDPCRIPCTITNDTISEVEVRVFLFDRELQSYVGDPQPLIHWQNIAAGEEYSFDGFWDTLNFRPDELKTYLMRVDLSEQHLGSIDSFDFEVVLAERPGWWGALLDAIGQGNTEQITEPILGLFTGFDIEGFTTPPYTCFLCGEVFSGEDADEDYAKHLISHIQAFIGDWFKK